MTLNNDTATATTTAAGFRAEKPARSFIAQKSQCSEMEQKGFEDRSALEAKYEKLYEPYYSKRREIVNGTVEVKGVVDGDVAKKEGDRATKGTSEAILMKSATKTQQKLSTGMSEAKPMESVTETQQNHSTGELQNIQAVYKLNGRNYQQWSQLVKTLLKGKGKLSHLNGGGPDPSDPRFDTWDKEDSMIMYWLWNSMQPEIAGTFMLFTTAQEIWEAVRQTYSKMHNAVKIYEIKTKVAATRQGSSSVTEYADILKSFWREVDDYENIEMKCSEDAITFRRFVERERIFCFLAGLNVEFDQVRVQVLGKEDMPSMNETIAIVQAEESRRVVMLEPQPVEGSTLVSINSGGGGQPGGSKSSKPTIWCNHCKKPWHTVENCWKLHGKPQKTVGKYQNGGFNHWQQRGQTHLTNTLTSFQDHTEFIGGKEAEFKRDFEKLGNLLQSIDDYDDPFGMCSLALSESDYDDFTKEDYLYNAYMEDDECFW